MKTRRRALRILVILLVVLGGVVFGLKYWFDQQPQEHQDPGIPDVKVPDPDDLDEAEIEEPELEIPPIVNPEGVTNS